MVKLAAHVCCNFLETNILVSVWIVAQMEFNVITDAVVRFEFDITASAFQIPISFFMLFKVV